MLRSAACGSLAPDSSSGSSTTTTTTNARRRLAQQQDDAGTDATDNLRVDGGAGDRGTPNPFRIAAFGGGIGGNRFGGAGVPGGFTGG
jgi:hypothetical protein